MASDEQPIKQSDVALAVPHGLAMEDRDPDDINSHVKVSWPQDGLEQNVQTFLMSYSFKWII